MSRIFNWRAASFAPPVYSYPTVAEQAPPKIAEWLYVFTTIARRRFESVALGGDST
ncbi:hypothetical protein [Burkholderia glumae]|uniref:hypothetical protein n=1 Tax=Burkholderia glumae TaxID=337 RepID=UPI001297FA13|nr:hypothetical protein [Burkholderia glumae]